MIFIKSIFNYFLLAKSLKLFY